MSSNKDFILASVGGLLVLITGVVESAYNISLFLWNLSYVGVMFGILMLIGSFIIRYRPNGINTKSLGIEKTSRFPLGGFICLICSLVSLAFLQGFLIGPMMGIFASTSNYANVYKTRK